MPKEPVKLIDHRKIVAAERRERMRGRLVESAFLVLGQRGVDAGMIDEIIGLAGVSRGTFYNYFRSNEELLSAVATEVEREMLRVIDPVLHQSSDPALRICDSVRLHFDLIRRFPAFGAFVDRGGLRSITDNQLLLEYLSRDLGIGIASGRFSLPLIEVGFDTVVGAAFAGCRRIHFEHPGTDYDNALAAAILQALGVPVEAAAAITGRPLPFIELAPDSLFVRSNHLIRPEAS